MIRDLDHALAEAPRDLPPEPDWFGAPVRAPYGDDWQAKAFAIAAAIIIAGAILSCLVGS